jgi:hypothetical protein
MAAAATKNPEKKRLQDSCCTSKGNPEKSE